MKRIICLVLCVIMIGSCFTGVSAQADGIEIKVNIPKVLCTVTSGNGKYEVYYNGERVDGTTFYIEKNVPVTMQVKPALFQKIIYSAVNDEIIYSADGTNYEMTFTEEENKVEFYVEDTNGIVRVVTKIITAVNNFFKKIFKR